MSLTSDLESALSAALSGFTVPTVERRDGLPPRLATLPVPTTERPAEPDSTTYRRRSSRGPFRRWDRVDTTTITHNKEKGGVEIKFPGKPPTLIIDRLKREGWRWNPGQGVWWKRFSDTAMLHAGHIATMYEDNH